MRDFWRKKSPVNGFGKTVFRKIWKIIHYFYLLNDKTFSLPPDVHSTGVTLCIASVRMTQILVLAVVLFKKKKKYIKSVNKFNHRSPIRTGSRQVFLEK